MRDSKAFKLKNWIVLFGKTYIIILAISIKFMNIKYYAVCKFLNLSTWGEEGGERRRDRSLPRLGHVPWYASLTRSSFSNLNEQSWAP